MHLRGSNHAYPLPVFARPATSCCFYRQGNRPRDGERESRWSGHGGREERDREGSLFYWFLYYSRACPRAEDACLRARKSSLIRNTLRRMLVICTRRWGSMPTGRIPSSSRLLLLPLLLLPPCHEVSKTWRLLFIGVVLRVRNKCAPARSRDRFFPANLRKR